jgi:hypothetical protein
LPVKYAPVVEPETSHIDDAVLDVAHVPNGQRGGNFLNYEHSNPKEFNIYQPPSTNEIPEPIIADKYCVDQFSFDLPVSIFQRFIPNQWNKDPQVSTQLVV